MGLDFLAGGFEPLVAKTGVAPQRLRGRGVGDEGDDSITSKFPTPIVQNVANMAGAFL